MTDTSPAATRMCLICGMRVPVTHLRLERRNPMTDLTDEALDALITKLGMIHEWKVGVEAAAVITALRQREAEAVAGAIEAAAHLVSATAYTSNGGRRSLEPVSKWLEGQDMHHATIATAIRALHTDATRAALDRAKAEGMREAARLIPPAVSGAASIILAAADKLEGKS